MGAGGEEVRPLRYCPNFIRFSHRVASLYTWEDSWYRSRSLGCRSTWCVWPPPPLWWRGSCSYRLLPARCLLQERRKEIMRTSTSTRMSTRKSTSTRMSRNRSISNSISSSSNEKDEAGKVGARVGARVGAGWGGGAVPNLKMLQSQVSAFEKS